MTDNGQQANCLQGALCTGEGIVIDEALTTNPLEYRSAISQVEPSLERPQPKSLAVRTSIRLLHP